MAIAGQLALASCGLVPVGAVVGCTAKWMDEGDFGLGEVGCGYDSSRPSQNIATTAKSHVSFAAPAYSAWHSALERMLLEAQGLSADGVVDTVLTEKKAAAGVREFVVSGTAVRATGTVHLERPFTTTLSGSDVAKLIAAGWMPASIVLGLSYAIRHDTQTERRARGRLRSPCEVLGVTEVVQAARHDARQQLAARTRAVGAAGAVLSSQLALSIQPLMVSRTHRDIVATVRATATAIIEFAGDRSSSSGSCSVLPVTAPRMAHDGGWR
jgi:uncharacterized protein YbjQ (UPF0145 family)